MEKFAIAIPRPVEKSISKIPIPYRLRIWREIHSLKANPFNGEKMTGKLASKRKIRVWPYRIIYSIDKKKRIVVITQVAHRQGVYQ